MIKVYGMDTCPDCIAIKDEILKRKDEYEYIDISSHVHKLKEFLRIRDNNEVFNEVIKNGNVGIPCFVLENGEVTLDKEKAGIKNIQNISCSLEDHINGKKGC